MTSHFFATDPLQPIGESATHPTELRGDRLAALLLLAGMSPRRRHALPPCRRAAHSGVSNRRFQAEWHTT